MANMLKKWELLNLIKSWASKEKSSGISISGYYVHPYSNFIMLEINSNNLYESSRHYYYDPINHKYCYFMGAHMHDDTWFIWNGIEDEAYNIKVVENKVEFMENSNFSSLPKNIINSLYTFLYNTLNGDTNI